MKVYLASWFASKDEMNQRAKELQKYGIEVTSRWLQETVSPKVTARDVSDDYLRETARVDIEDVLLANVVVLNVPDATELESAGIPLASWARGGRHFEAGLQYATMMFLQYLPLKDRGMRKLILVGHRENVFHYIDEHCSNMTADGYLLPEIELCDTWEEAMDHLITLADREAVTRSA